MIVCDTAEWSLEALKWMYYNSRLWIGPICPRSQEKIPPRYQGPRNKKGKNVAGAEDTRQPKLPESLLRMRAGHVGLARSYKILRMLDARV